MCFDRVMDRGFGEVFVALSKKSNEKVAIKKVKLVSNDTLIEKESQLLKECHSRYIVRYYEVLKKDNELWVCCLLN